MQMKENVWSSDGSWSGLKCFCGDGDVPNQIKVVLKVQQTGRRFQTNYQRIYGHKEAKRLFVLLMMTETRRIPENQESVGVIQILERSGRHFQIRCKEERSFSLSWIIKCPQTTSSVFLILSRFGCKHFYTVCRVNYDCGQKLCFCCVPLNSQSGVTSEGYGENRPQILRFDPTVSVDQRVGHSGKNVFKFPLKNSMNLWE